MKKRILKFDSMAEVLEYIGAYDKAYADNYSRTLPKDSWCPYSWNEVVKFAEGADLFKPQNVEFGSDIQNKVVALDEGVNNNVLDFSLDICGEDVDLEQFMLGKPENMRTYEPPVAKRVVNVIVQCGGHCGISSDTLERRGAAVLGLLQGLQDSARFIINARLCFMTSDHNDTEMIAFIDVDFSKIWSRQMINFIMGSVGTFRRLGFAVLEKMHNEKNCYGYGRPLSIAAYMRGLKDSKDTNAQALLGNEGDTLLIFDKLDSNHSKEEIDNATMDVVNRMATGDKKVTCNI